ncbi:HAD family phosphatase [Vibrio sp. SM6]|uniref:HAD family phosphatase n=1 Tax=Vibrio agarilyticus TaxID=2726741 RepID=A0A7X8TPT1_9VIBR|nr:Cof-type HAD-IIB family hydrolase [Vibrio agarilyticus]NLS12525.1 HAD family phosphatase [Vibrio agarilyticus]
MYKLIALDMDGTLLTSDKRISPRTKTAIERARTKGVTVVLASGRPIDGMQAKLDELEICGENEFVLYYNGSMVKHLGNDNKIIHQQIIDGATTKQLTALAADLGVYIHAFSQVHGLITPELNPYTDIEANINGLDITVMDFNTLEDDHPIIKAMFVAEPTVLTKAIAKLPPQWRESHTVVQSAPFFLEFLNPNSNKGVGVAAIANYLGIQPDEVICVGDAENDHHMIEYAGLGVAMANAMAETQALANHITSSNDEDGVAEVIEQFILNNA